MFKDWILMFLYQLSNIINEEEVEVTKNVAIENVLSK